MQLMTRSCIVLTSPLRASVVSDAGSDTSEHCEPACYPQTKTWKEMDGKHITRSVQVFTVFFAMYEQALMRMLLLKDDYDWSPQHETQGNQLSEPDEFLSATCKRQKKIKNYS